VLPKHSLKLELVWPSDKYRRRSGSRSRGYGRRLLEAMVSWLFARGLTKLYLSTAPNTRAARFYDAAGWQFRRILANGEALYELVDPSAP